MLKNISNKKNSKKIDFIDREYHRELVDNAYTEIIKNCTELKVIFLYGAGGFGKTHLLKNCLNNMTNPLAKPIHIPLEITNKDDKLDILIKFRKALPKKHFYPLFDYAIQLLWNNLNTSQMDTEFLSYTQNSLFQFLKSGADALVTARFPQGIATASLIEVVDAVYTFLKKMYDKHSISTVLDDIKTMQTYELINLLPDLLGLDIHKAFLEDILVLVIDSYQQYSRSLVDPSSWLINLVKNVGYGMFVITSRENIVWPDDLKKYVVPKELNELPSDEVRKTLITQFNVPPELLENIITVTGCIPIYLDLAIKVLDSNDWNNQSNEQFYFKSKEDIIQKFLIHLPENERQAIMTLAIVQIFNETIFEFLVKDLQIAVSVVDFEDICQRSLIRNVEYDQCFYKTHEVISKNISTLKSSRTIQRILKSYITIIRDRVIYDCTSTQILMLFKHVISLIIFNKLSVPEEETEQLLDIYFVIKESLLPFDCDDIQGFRSYEPLNDIYCFLKALSEERQDSKYRLTLLDKISEDTCHFGKHIKSLRLMKGYLKALCEGSHWLKQIVNKLNPALTDAEMQEWYYGQTKIFFGDCCVSYGEFKTGIRELESYQRQLPNLIGKENDAFQITRHIAHGYRFNMFLEEAEIQYRSIIEKKDTIPTILQKVYILTNLCETCCYFKPEEVLKIKDEAFSLAEKFNDLKSKGKICYSLAIVYLLQRKYDLVEKYIEDSISYNKTDGYIAGQLYAYMVQAYYEYAHDGNISEHTMIIIKKLQAQIHVYGYFSLPIAMMQENYSKLKQIRLDYEWLDFDKTVLAYRKFLDSIRIH